MSLEELAIEFENIKRKINPILTIQKNPIQLFIVKRDGRFFAGDGIQYIGNDWLQATYFEEPEIIYEASYETIFEEYKMFSGKSGTDVSVEEVLEKTVFRLKKWYEKETRSNDKNNGHIEYICTYEDINAYKNAHKDIAQDTVMSSDDDSLEIDEDSA